MPEPQEQTARVASLFDALSSSYDAVGMDFFQPIADGLLAAMPPRPGESWLDVGCGRGAVLLPAAEVVGPAGRAVGVDISAGMVEQTRVLAAARGLGHVEAVVGDAAAPPVTGRVRRGRVVARPVLPARSGRRAEVVARSHGTRCAARRRDVRPSRPPVAARRRRVRPPPAGADARRPHQRGERAVRVGRRDGAAGGRRRLRRGAHGHDRAAGRVSPTPSSGTPSPGRRPVGGCGCPTRRARRPAVRAEAVRRFTSYADSGRVRHVHPGVSATRSPRAASQAARRGSGPPLDPVAVTGHTVSGARPSSGPRSHRSTISYGHKRLG